MSITYRLNFETTPDELSTVCYGDTDSVFMILKTKSYKKFTELSEKVSIENSEELDKLKTVLIQESFDTGKVLAEEISRYLFKNPINLEFEKVYYPIILFSKKRYIGNYYGTSADTIDFVEKKGIVLKRRDNPDIVKKLYQQFIDPILRYGKPGIAEAVLQLEKEIVKIMENKNDIQDLIVTKSLSKSYGKERCEAIDCEKSATRQIPYNNIKYYCKRHSEDMINLKELSPSDKKGTKCSFCPEAGVNKKAHHFYCKKHSEQLEDQSNVQVINNVYSTENSPHIALCKKITERDPGASPVVGDRINYVFIDDGNPKSKLFERAEDPQYVIDNRLKIDVNYYINNQLKKPISEMLQFLIPNHKTFFDDILKSKEEIAQKKQTKMDKFLVYKGNPKKIL